MSKQKPITLTEMSVTVCSSCLDGVGGTCWTPGCLFWMSDSPDTSLAVRLRLSAALDGVE